MRYLLGFDYDNSGQPSLPHVHTLADGQMVASMVFIKRAALDV